MGAILQQSRGDSEIEGGRDLERPRVAVDDTHVSTDLLNEAGVVGGVTAVGVGMLEHLTQEPLGSLYAAQRVAVRSRQDVTLRVDHLDGVGHCEAGDDSGVAFAYGVDDSGKEISGRQTPGGVMNQDDAVIRVERIEPRLHRG